MPVWKVEPRGPNLSPMPALERADEPQGGARGWGPKRRERARPGDTVHSEPRPALKTTERVVGAPPEGAVERRQKGIRATRGGTEAVRRRSRLGLARGPACPGAGVRSDRANAVSPARQFHPRGGRACAGSGSRRAASRGRSSRRSCPGRTREPEARPGLRQRESSRPPGPGPGRRQGGRREQAPAR